ncbi:MAG TPA: iron ABC transporter permease [Anaerovoracaceae bacterium]|nr:iron ABC transporter permease [Anaerovoracaceae bacterium]
MMEKRNATIQSYHSFVNRKKWFFWIVLLGIIITAVFAVSSGSMQLKFTEVIKAFFLHSDVKTQMVVFNIRLPRVLTAIVIGAALAVSGAVMQCVLQNPLASASTLGVSQGAAFGAAVGIIVFGGGIVSYDSSSSGIAINNPYIVTLCAFFFGSISTFVVVVISRLKSNLGPGGIILVGVALGSLFAGGSTLLQYFADETKISALVFWTFGNLGAANFKEISIVTAVFIVAMIYFMMNSWNYNAMESGADTAKSLGVKTRKVTLLSLTICSLTAACAVSFVGIISFVGLVAPHIMRRFVGNDYRYLIPCSAAMGALLLVFADTFARLIIAPVILPIGAITSFLGAPLFIYILFKGEKIID